MQMHANAVKVTIVASRARWVTVAGIAGVTLMLAVEVLRRGLDRLVAALDAPLPEPAFIAVGEIVTATGGCWLAVGTLCIALGDAPWGGSGVTRRIARRLVPRCWRAAVHAAVGAGLLAGPALGAAAATAVHAPADQRPHHPRGRALTVLDGLSLPDRANGGLPGRSTVVVSRGDCLWALAATALPRTATDASIARHTERWYQANARVIGDDPDLLLPGTRLHPPDAAR